MFIRETVTNMKVYQKGELSSSSFLTISISLLYCFILAHSRKANSSLCFSNSERQTLLYRLNVK